MPHSVTDTGIRDNHSRGSVASFLKEKILHGSTLSIVSAYFTIYAYEALKDTLDRIEHLDFLFGEPSFVNRLDPSKTEKKAFIVDAGGLELANKLHQKRVAEDCADWIGRKVSIKTIKQSNLLHGKMYHIATGRVQDAILGSSNFTVRGLGLAAQNNNIELNLIVDGNRDRQDLKCWFDELWNNDNLVKDVKQEVLLYLKQLYENHPPEFIYYKTLFHIFETFLADSGKTDADLRCEIPDEPFKRVVAPGQFLNSAEAINNERAVISSRSVSNPDIGIPSSCRPLLSGAGKVDSNESRCLHGELSRIEDADNLMVTENPGGLHS